MSAPQKPVPTPDGLNAEFYQNCARGQLCFQRCGACGAWRHLPRHLCAECGSPEWSWAESSGRGRVYSWTVTHRSPLPAFAGDTPFAVIVVEMEEGVRLVSGLRDAAPESLELDQSVEVVLEAVSEEVALPYFRPRRGS